MYLVNTTFYAEKAVFDEALEMVRRVYLPMVGREERFSDALLVKILVAAGEEMSGFALQFKSGSLEDAMAWIEDGDSAKFLNMLARRFGERLLRFTTPMEIIM